MFARVKESRNEEYLQIVENYRDGGRVRQRLVLYVGHYDSIDHALRQMPRDLRGMRSRRTRLAKHEFFQDTVEQLNRWIDAIDERLQALRALVDEHPDLVERDRARAARHRQRARAAMDERRETLRQRSDQLRCSEEGCNAEAFVVVDRVEPLCRTHYEEARPYLEEAARAAAERREALRDLLGG